MWNTMQDFQISTSREKTFLVSSQKPPDTCHHEQGPIEKTEKEHTHGFLHSCQPPACQGIPEATANRSEKKRHCVRPKRRETTSRQTREQHTSKKVTKKERKSFVHHMAKQREGSSGQHLADVATLPSAEPTTCICRHNREVVNTKEKERKS